MCRRCDADGAFPQISQEIMRVNGVLPGIKARLFPYQTEGVAFLASRGRALLADDMGLARPCRRFAPLPGWLIMPVSGRFRGLSGSLKHQWAREVAKFTSHPVQIIQV